MKSFAFCFLFLLLFGCQTFQHNLPTEYRKLSFRYAIDGFDCIKSEGEVDEEIELTIKVKIVSNRAKFDWKKATYKDSTVRGYARRDGSIYIFGKKVNGKIIINQNVLGHEVFHQLQFKYPHKFFYPDHLDRYGL